MMSTSVVEPIKGESEVILKNQGHWPKYDGYSPLSNDRNEIRLLKFGDHPETGPLNCSLHAASLDDQPDFSALSYYWGAPVPRHKLKEIMIGKSKVLVRPTLELFLRNLAQQAQPTYFWLDVLCIDQRNVVERGQQVARMGAIYKAAQKTYVWLGEGDADTDYVCEYIRGGDGSMNSAALEPMRGYVEQFFWRPYWRRMWVVQEFILSKHVHIMIGDQCVKWELLDAVCKRMIPALQKPVNRLHDPQQLTRWYYGQHHGGSTGSGEQSIPVPWTWYIKMREARQDSSLIDSPLLALMLRFQEQQCIDQRDKVYGLLALTDEAIVLPDYEISPTELYFRLLAALQPPCCYDGFVRQGSEIFSILNVESLVRRCIRPQREQIAQCLQSNRALHFSHFCGFIGKVTIVDKRGTSREPCPLSSIGMPGHMNHAWVLRLGDVEPKVWYPLEHPSECLDSRFPQCYEMREVESNLRTGVSSSSGRFDDSPRTKDGYYWTMNGSRHLHVSNIVEVGDLVFESGVSGFAIMVRNGQIVDIGLTSNLTAQFPANFHALIPTKNVLSIKEMLLKGIRVCKKGLHTHNRYFNAGDTEKDTLFKVLFHVDRLVLTLLLIFSYREFAQGTFPASINDTLRTVLSVYKTIDAEDSTSVSSTIPDCAASECSNEQQYLSKRYECLREQVRYMGADFESPSVDVPDGQITCEQGKGDSTLEDRIVRRNWSVALICLTKTVGIPQRQERYVSWPRQQDISGVLFTDVMGDNQAPGTYWELDRSACELIGLAEPGAQESNHNFPLLCTLQDCADLTLNDQLILTAKHYTAPHVSQIDLKAFLYCHAGRLEWLEVLLAYDDEVCFDFERPHRTPIRHTGAGSADENLYEILRSASLVELSLPGYGIRLNIQVLQPNRTWKFYSADLNEHIFWAEGRGLRFGRRCYTKSGRGWDSFGQYQSDHESNASGSRGILQDRYCKRRVEFL